MFKHVPLENKELNTVEVNGKRFYDVNGDLLPSVTTVLSSFQKQGLAEWRARVGDDIADRKMKVAAARGTSVHQICEDYVLNKPDYKSGKMPIMVDLFNQIKKYLDENIEMVHAVEGSLYSKELRAAGKCDLICRMHGVNCIVDYKTSNKPKKEEWIENYFFQETAYSIMVEEMYNLNIFYIITLIAVENESLQVFIKRPGDYREQVINLFKLYHLEN